MYYLQSRYYDPVVGRFLNADTLLGANEDLLSYNLFAYCSNNPVMYSDPSGESILLACVLIFAGLTAAACGLLAYEMASYYGAQGWELVGWTALGVITGGIIGACFGYYIAPSIAAFVAKSFVLTFGGGMALEGGGIVGGAIAVSITGAQILVGALVGVLGLGASVMFAKQASRSPKARATDKPSWVNRDMINKNITAQENARKLLNDKYGIGNWFKGPGTKFNKIVKWIIRDIFG